MCFTIDKNAVAPKRNFAYKVLRLTDRGGLRSPTKWMSTRWQVGKTKRLQRDAVVSQCDNTSFAGLYVYLTRPVALKALRDGFYKHNRYVLVKVRAEPEDFIHSAVDGRDFGKATYRKLTPLKIVAVKYVGVVYTGKKCTRVLKKLGVKAS